MDFITAFSTGRADLQRLWNLREHGIDVNVSVICKGDFIECHRSPLIVASPVFRFWLNANPSVLPLNIEVYEAMMILKVVYGVAFSFPRSFLPRLVSLLERFQLRLPPLSMGNSAVPVTQSFAGNRYERPRNYQRYDKKLIPGVSDVRALEESSKRTENKDFKQPTAAACDQDKETDYNEDSLNNITNDYKLFGDVKGRFNIFDLFKTQTEEKHLTGCQCYLDADLKTSSSEDTDGSPEGSTELDVKSYGIDKREASKELMEICSKTIVEESSQENMCDTNVISKDLSEVEQAIRYLDNNLLQNFFRPIRDDPATSTDVSTLHSSSLVDGIRMITNKPLANMPTRRRNAISDRHRKTKFSHAKESFLKSQFVQGGIMDDPVCSEDKEVQDILSKNNDQMDCLLFKELWDVTTKGLQESDNEIWEGVSVGGRGSLMINEDLVKKAKNNSSEKSHCFSSEGVTVQDICSYEKKFSLLHEQLQTMWGLKFPLMPGIHSEQLLWGTKYAFMPGMHMNEVPLRMV